jgi:plasmid stabilization system protein ParE
MGKVILTEPALAQFEAIVDFIALDKPEAARVTTTRIFLALDQLGDFAHLGRPIREFPHPGYRQIWIKPCWFYYRLSEGTITILHVRRAEKPLSIEYLLNEDD